MKLVVKKKAKLLDYLYYNLDMPRKRIKQYLTHGSIFVNQTKTKQFDYPLYTNDVITIDTNQKDKKNLSFPIIFEDEHILVVEKPSGLLTIATNKEKEKTLYHIVREYVKQTNKNNKIFIVHRLDKDTSGIVIFSKDEKTKKDLQENWNNYVSLREYVAVVHGRVNKHEGKIVEYLKETKTHLVYASKDKDGKEAITKYKVIKESNDYSLVQVIIETGRTNQIRVAFNNLGNPIVGDNKYGIKDNEKRLFLHANRLKIYYPVIKKEILFEISTPQDFKKKLR